MLQKYIAIIIAMWIVTFCKIIYTNFNYAISLDHPEEETVG